MAPNINLQRARSPSSRRRPLLLPTILQHIQDVRNKSNSTANNFINDSIKTSPTIDLSDLSNALESPSSSDKHKQMAKVRGVRFNNKVSIVEIEVPERIQSQRVSFSAEVVDIDTAESTHSSPSPSPPKKRVRFGCLKTNVCKHLSHTSIYKMKNYEAISPLMRPKKRVRFGCMKGEAPVVTHMNMEVTDLFAEEAATFKREKRRGSTSDADSKMSEQTLDSEDTEVD